MINLLFSGIDKQKGFTEKQAEYLKKDIRSNSIISFIASDFNNYSKNDTIYNRMISFFKNIDISFKESYLIDSRNNIELKNIITKSNIIFLMGGDPKQQMDYINEYKIKDYIDKNKVIVGVSAGTMNHSKKVIYKDKTIINYSGLGYVDINIYPHLDFNNIELLKEAFEVSNYQPLVLLPNESFIRVENGLIEYVGEYYNISNNTIDIKRAPYDKINHKGTTQLESERLIYRRTTKNDINEFFYIQLNPKLNKYLGKTKIGTNPETNLKYFDENKYQELDFYRWTIERKEDKKLLGTIYLNIHDEKAKTAGIDYWIREDEWSKGYITEASRRILKFAFEELDLNRIESCGAKDNKGTWRVMEKIGLIYEGERKKAMFYYYGGIQDLVMYGLTKEEYQKNNKKTTFK